MEHQLYKKRRVAMIRVEPYLAAYARRKFEVDPQSGGIRIPDSFDLYHCVWQSMERRPRGYRPTGNENLCIWLPARRAIDGMAQKNPAFWNYISPRHQWAIEKQLRRLFNWELHHFVEQQLEHGCTKVEAVRQFVRLYHLGLDCEDALLKHLQRHERTMRVFLNISKPKKGKK